VVLTIGMQFCLGLILFHLILSKVNQINIRFTRWNGKLPHFVIDAKVVNINHNADCWAKNKIKVRVTGYYYKRECYCALLSFLTVRNNKQFIDSNN